GSAGHLRALLFDAVPVTLTGGSALVSGSADGVLTGGNLALLAAGIGTPDAGSARGTIVVLEDVGEDVYRLDRMLTQLLRSGWLAGVRGVVLGDFADCAPAELVRPMLVDRLGGLGVPVLWGAPVGHDKRNLAFCYGVPARVDADAGTVTTRVAPLS
ncbi:MAG: LD-carboxypeptidase, partial [Nocardioidaceae bacterium]